MATKFRTQFNRLKMSPGEVNNKPSLTIPDQTLTLQQILERYAKGIGFAGSGGAVYDEDEGGHIPDFRRMDLTEQHDYIQETAKDLEAKMEAGKISKRKKESDAEFERRLEEWKKSQPKPDNPSA